MLQHSHKQTKRGCIGPASDCSILSMIKLMQAGVTSCGMALVSPYEAPCCSSLVYQKKPLNEMTGR